MTRGKAGFYSGRITASTLTFFTQPRHNYSATSGDAVEFSSLASGVSGVTYQWQALLSGYWQNIYGKTSSSVTITPSDLYTQSDAFISIRCFASSESASQYAISDVVRYAQYHLANYASGMYAYVSGENSLLTPTSSVTVNGDSYQIMSLATTEGFSFSAGTMGSSSGDYSWFTGDDFLFSLEESMNASTWSTVASAGYRQYPSWYGTLYSGGLSAQTRYYRLNATRPWPLTAVNQNSTLFANRPPLSGVLLRWRATWS